MRYIIFISSIVISLHCISQEKGDRNIWNQLTWSIVPFNFDIGNQHIELSNSIPMDYNFLMRSNSKYLVTINFVEFQILYKNAVGLNIGFDYANKGVKRDLIYNDIQDNVKNLNISIPKTDYENGIVPITDKQDVFSLKIALVGNLNIGRFSFNPFVAGILPINRSSLRVTANCFDPSNNVSFDRKYTINQVYQTGIKAGFDTRFMISNNLFIGARIGYNYIKMNGKGTTLDVFEDGSQFVSSSSDFYRVNSNLFFGGNIGLVFGYGYKKG